MFGHTRASHIGRMERGRGRDPLPARDGSLPAERPGLAGCCATLLVRRAGARHATRVRIAFGAGCR
jgi:hypothetical protein